MPKHLIKRREVDFDLKDGWYTEVSLNKSPIGSNVESGDTIYVAQNGYAIYGKGVVDQVLEFKFHSLQEFVQYAMHKSKVDDKLFWLSKFKIYSEKLPVSVIKGFEYNLIDTVSFDSIIPLEKRFLQRQTWYYLEDDFTLTFPSLSENITLHIPSKIRSGIYNRFKIVSNEHIIDIDHFVPRSIGGPGSIIENLIPVSVSINRIKSNHVPSKLFDLAEDFGFKKPKGFILSHDKYYSTRDSIKLAKEIVQKINQQEISEIKKTYKKIRDFHYPYLKNII
jgi:hypothetical protein